MSIYQTPVERLQWSDLQELLSERAVENARLEFKSARPGKDETLKKLSSFANTFGGHLVIGVKAASEDGRVESIPGVEVSPNMKQTLIQWCNEGVHPPLDPEVSDAIPVPGSDERVVYVVHIHESSEAPHFLNGRKGVYVRTNEYSKRFEPRFATQPELLAIMNRRRALEQRREALLMRARARFQAYVDEEYTSHPNTAGNVGARMSLIVVPRYPTGTLWTYQQLMDQKDRVRVAWRGGLYPSTYSSTVTQHESVICLGPATGFSVMEINQWGMLHYVTEVEEKVDEKISGIHLHSVMGHLLVFLRHAGLLLQGATALGTVAVVLRFEGVRGKPWLYQGWGGINTKPASKLDDSVEIEHHITSEDLLLRADDLVAALMRQAFFALNWSEVTLDQGAMRRMIQMGYKFNFWNVPTSN